MKFNQYLTFTLGLIIIMLSFVSLCMGNIDGTQFLYAVSIAIGTHGTKTVLKSKGKNDGN